jgi:hypothetical protein
MGVPLLLGFALVYPMFRTKKQRKISLWKNLSKKRGSGVEILDSPGDGYYTKPSNKGGSPSP